MKRVQIDFISDGFRELLMSDDISEQVGAAAQKVAAEATKQGSQSKNRRHNAEPARYIVEGPKPGNYGGGRVIAYVAAENAEARRDAIYAHRLERVIWEVKS